VWLESETGKCLGGFVVGEFEDLISALRTAEVFGEDMAKMKRRRRPSTPYDTLELSRERVTSTQA